MARWLVPFALLHAACSIEASGLAAIDAGGAELDASVQSDAPAVADSGRRDGGPIDARPADTGFAGNDAGIDTGVIGVDAGPVPDGGCTPAWNSCVGSVETACNTATGALVTRTCPAGCRPTEPRCARVDPSNVDVVVAVPAAADVVVTGNVSWSTTSCAEPGMARVAALAGGAVCALRTGAFTVSGTIAVRGDVPLVVLAEGPVQISGTIDVSAYGTNSGPGGGEGGTRARTSGLGPRPGGGGTHIDWYEDGGGGGGGACGAGGSGGVGDSAAGGSGGGVHGSGWVLEPLYGGSGGGLGPGGAGSDYDNNGYGGAGGGALQITSQTSITVSGRILAGGGGGDGGKRDGSQWGAGGGGGAGGSVLLEAPAVSLGAGGYVRATGGGGGGSASTSNAGGDGTDGALATGRAAGGLLGGVDYGATGGSSGAGSTPDALSGFGNENRDANGGGGGGGAGCILFRTGDGSMPAGAGRSSPSTGLGLRALGIVRY